MFTGLLIYGANASSKDWMPLVEHNYYSWSYWSQMIASFLCLISASFFYSEAKSVLMYFSPRKRNDLDEQREIYKQSLNSNTTNNNNINSTTNNNLIINNEALSKNMDRIILSTSLQSDDDTVDCISDRSISIFQNRHSHI